MTTPLDRITARLDHAREQLEILNGELDAFNKSKPYRAWLECEAQSGDYLFWAEPTKEVPLRLGFLTGDFVNNVRSCLDNLVCALPGANIEKAAFPILRKDPAPKSFEHHVTKLKGVDPAALRVIESLQPYRPTKHASSVAIPIGELLMRLDLFWNSDKHRSPTFGVSTLQRTVFQLNPQEFTVIDANFGYLESRRVILRVRPISPDHPKPSVEGYLAAQICFKEAPGLAGPVPVDLNDFYQCVRDDVLPLFAQFL